jgi:hypothetical protein
MTNPIMPLILSSLIAGSAQAGTSDRVTYSIGKVMEITGGSLFPDVEGMPRGIYEPNPEVGRAHKDQVGNILDQIAESNGVTREMNTTYNILVSASLSLGRAKRVVKERQELLDLNLNCQDYRNVSSRVVQDNEIVVLQNLQVIDRLGEELSHNGELSKHYSVLVEEYNDDLSAFYMTAFDGYGHCNEERPIGE